MSPGSVARLASAVSSTRSYGRFSSACGLVSPTARPARGVICSDADRLLPPALPDVDGNAEDRRGTVSVSNGPAPNIETFDGPEEAQAVRRVDRRTGRTGTSAARDPCLRPIDPRASPGAERRQTSR